jgi:hypothetical protein
MHLVETRYASKHTEGTGQPLTIKDYSSTSSAKMKERLD